MGMMETMIIGAVAAMVAVYVLNKRQQNKRDGDGS